MEKTEADSVADLARKSMNPEILPIPGADHRHVLVIPEGCRTEDIDLEQHLPRPLTRRSTLSLGTLSDWLEYTFAHGAIEVQKMEGSVWNPTIFISKTDLRFLTVFDHHDGESAARNDATCDYRLQKSKELLDWVRQSGEYMSQEEFIEWIEDHEHQFDEPSSGQWMTLAEDFRITQNANFSSKYDPTSGAIDFAFQRENEEKGDIKVPANFSIILPLFEGDKPFKLSMRFRYRCSGGQVRFGFRFTNLDKAIDHCWDRLVESVMETEFPFEIPIFQTV